MKMGGGPKQFGVDAEAVPGAARAIGRAGACLRGLPHLQRLAEPAAPTRSARRSRRRSSSRCGLPQRRPRPVRVLNIGGGFGIPYFPGERPLDLAPIGENLARICRRAPRSAARSHARARARPLSRRRSRHLRVPRRRPQGSRGQVFLVTDGGLHHHLAASGNFGQVIRKNYPVVIGNRVSGAQREIGIGRRSAVHAARSSRRPDGPRRCATGRSRRRVPVRRLRADRQPDGVPRAIRRRSRSCAEQRRVFSQRCARRSMLTDG